MRVNQSRSEINISLSLSSMTQSKISHVGFEHCVYDVTSQAFQLDPTLFLAPPSFAKHIMVDSENLKTMFK